MAIQVLDSTPMAVTPNKSISLVSSRGIIAYCIGLESPSDQTIWIEWRMSDGLLLVNKDIYIKNVSPLSEINIDIREVS